MNFGDLKTRLKALINRRDLTDQLAGTFVTDAISDLEREVRIGPMELLVTATEWDGVRNAIEVPGNYLESINLFTPTCELDQADLSTFLRIADRGGLPSHFVRMADQWLFRPTPAPGTSIHVHFYAQSERLTNDLDSNVWTRAAPNAVVYTAAALAADFFQMEDPHAQRYLARAGQYVASLQEQDNAEKWGGRITIPRPSGVGDY